MRIKEVSQEYEEEYRFGTNRQKGQTGRKAKTGMNRYVLGKGIVGAGRWILLAIVSFLILFPVLWIFVSSITPPGELFKTPIDYIPDHPTLDSYTFLIENVGLFEKSEIRS